ncbi:MAG: hypothetical protein LM590_04880 [Thermofilum sp.]|nr:hypothetical protein [Thermofilum sp.]
MSVEEAVFTIFELALLAGAAFYLHLLSNTGTNDLLGALNHLPNGSCVIILSDKPMTLPGLNISGKLSYVCRISGGFVFGEKK